MYILIKKILFPILIFFLVFVLALYTVKYNTTDSKVTSYTLRAYKNTVALYQNDRLIKTYDDIVLSTLPPQDIQNFSNGISVATPTQAEAFLEDFDG